MPSGTNTIFFIPKDKVPAGRTVTYGRIVAEIRPKKAETNRTRLTLGVDLINFLDDVTTPTAICKLNRLTSARSWNKDSIWDKHHLLHYQGQSTSR